MSSKRKRALYFSSLFIASTTLLSLSFIAPSESEGRHLRGAYNAKTADSPDANEACAQAYATCRRAINLSGPRLRHFDPTPWLGSRRYFAGEYTPRSRVFRIPLLCASPPDARELQRLMHRDRRERYVKRSTLSI